MSKIKKTIEERLVDPVVPEEEQPYQVPENWSWTNLKNLAEVKGGKRLPKGEKLLDIPTDYPYIRVADFNNGSIENKDLKFITKEIHEKISRYTVSCEDVYISIAGTIGKVGLIPPYLDGANLTENAAKITDIKCTNKNFLFYVLNSETVKSQIKMAIKATSQPKLALHRIQDFKIPLPPINEQKRIVEKVEGLLNKIDEAKQLIEEARETFELRRAAILDKAIRGELTTKWRTENGLDFIREEFEIRELVSNLNQGWSPKCENYSSNDFQKWGVIKTTAIQAFEFKEEENKQLPDFLEPREKHELKEGDILITRAGPRIRVGVSCVIKQVRPRLMLCDKAYRFRVKLERVIPEYLVLALNTPDIMEKINAMKTGISESGVNLTQNKFLSIKLKIPHIDEQKKIMRIVENFFENSQKALMNCDVEEKIEILKHSILSKAFRGQLGTNTPSEENVINLIKEVLLEKQN